MPLFGIKKVFISNLSLYVKLNLLAKFNYKIYLKRGFFTPKTAFTFAASIN